MPGLCPDLPQRRAFSGALKMETVISGSVKALYLDDSVAVCVKPVGLDAQKAMPEALQRQYGGEFFCIHRLDRDVGGVMIYARSRSAATALSRAIASGVLEKQYLAVCAGCPAPEEGELDDLLYHDSSVNKTYVVKRMRKGVKEASLRYRVLESNGNLSLVSVCLLTGRTHQIRVQFASRRMPLAGDVKYGSRFRDCGISLWSAALSVPHPLTGEILRFSAPPPMGWPWNLFSEGGAANAQFQTGALL